MTTKRILIIDDNRELLTVTELALEEAADWEVMTATSGQDGITQAESEQPDAILLDVIMPGIDGFSVLEQLKANARTQDIPVIFLTAKAVIDDLERFQDARATSLIAKPFDFLSLANQVAMILGWQV